MKVVGQAGNGQELVELCRKCSPDVVIMDVGMPGVNGIRATAWLLEECPDVAVLGLSMHADRRRAMSSRTKRSKSLQMLFGMSPRDRFTSVPR